MLAEWFKTLADLPAGLKLAVELGLVSSLQLARFLSVDCRPTLVRAVHRTLPTPLARAFVGRLMADPSFLGKLAVEQGITLGAGLMLEAQQRGSRLGGEADFAAANLLTLAAANAALVWSVAPSRVYGAAHTAGWAKAVAGLPNYVFDTCGPLRQYNTAARAAGLAVKAAQLSGVGAAIGVASWGLNRAALARHRATDPAFSPSVPLPSLQTTVGGYAAWLGLSGNVRYQLLGGADRWMRERLSSLGTCWAATTGARLANNAAGDASRLWLLGLPAYAYPALMAQPARVAAPTGRVTGAPVRRQRTPAQIAAARQRRAAAAAAAAAAAQPGGFTVSAGVAPPAPRRERARA